MARPVRGLWRDRKLVRRRHRTWIFSMCMASLGWGAWWTSLCLVHFAPSIAPSLSVTAWVAGVCAAVGVVAAFWGFRARTAWLVMLAIPFLANASLLLAPIVFRTLRVVDTDPPVRHSWSAPRAIDETCSWLARG